MRLTASILPRLAVPEPGLVLVPELVPVPEQVPVLELVLELVLEQALVPVLELVRHTRQPTSRPTRYRQ